MSVVFEESDFSGKTKNYILKEFDKKGSKNGEISNSVSNSYLLQMDDRGMFDATLDDIPRISYIGNNKKINSLLNLSRKENWNLEQSDDNKNPLFVKSSINNKFYCLQFLGSNSNNLHLSSNVNLLQSYLNVFVVYALKSKNSMQDEVCLFKINDRETSQAQVSNTFGISFIQNNFYVSNSSPYQVTNWQTKPNGFETNKLICLSSHWDQNNLNRPKKGKLYINGKEIHSFYTLFKKSHDSSTKFYLGSKSNNYGQFDGEIFYVYVSTRKTKEKEIALNHYFLCKKFEIDFDEEEVIKYI